FLTTSSPSLFFILSLHDALPIFLPFDTVYGSFFSLAPLLAFVGAMLTVLLVYSIARSDGHTPVVTLLLAGVVINAVLVALQTLIDRKSTRLNSSHLGISYAVFCL